MVWLKTTELLPWIEELRNTCFLKIKYRESYTDSEERWLVSDLFPQGAKDPQFEVMVFLS